MSNPTMSIARQLTTLPVHEELRLYHTVWNREPGAQEAREALVLSNGFFISILARRFSVLYDLDYEDLFQYGCLLFLEHIDRVPRTSSHPSKWLYRCLQGRFMDQVKARYQDYGHGAVSLDCDNSPYGDDDEITLYNQIVEGEQDSQGRHDRLEHRARAVREAVHRLPYRQQEALHAYYQFEFATTNTQSRYGNHRAATETTPQVLGCRRKHAYQALRKDNLLVLALAGRAV